MKTCERCHYEFSTYAGYSRHVVNGVCTRPTDPLPVTINSANTNTNTNTNTDTILRADVVDFGKETFDTIPQYVVLESFGTKDFDPMVIKYQYFNSEYPENMNLLYAGKGMVAIKRNNGWETRTLEYVTQVLLKRMICAVVSRPDVHRIMEIDEYIRIGIDYWSTFMVNHSSRSPVFICIQNAIKHEIEKYTTHQRLAAIQEFLNRPL